MRNIFKIASFTVAVVALGGSGAAGAQTFGSTATATMSITATVTGTCTIAAPSLNASLQGAVGNTITTSGNFTVTCATGASVPYAIGLGNGNNYTTTRRLANGTNYVGYSLTCATGACSTTWGNTSANWYSGTTATANTPQNVLVNLTIPALTSAATTGSSTDSVTATLNY